MSAKWVGALGRGRREEGWVDDGDREPDGDGGEASVGLGLG